MELIAEGDKLKPGTSGSQYDWENKLVIRVSVAELAKLLTVFSGTEKQIELRHATEKEGQKISSHLLVAKEPKDSHSVKLTKVLVRILHD